jgi:hypothetical protein
MIDAHEICVDTIAFKKLSNLLDFNTFRGPLSIKGKFLKKIERKEGVMK